MLVAALACAVAAVPSGCNGTRTVQSDGPPSKTSAAAEPSSAAPLSGGVRYLALGDSYTIGQGVDEASRWPVLLQGELARAGCGDAALSLVARTGWTAGELYSAMTRLSLEPGFDLITLQVGVNDQYRGHPVQTFRSDLTRLLEEVGRLSGGRPGRVIVVSIPDWSASPFGTYSSAVTAAEIDAFNSVLQGEAAARGFRFVDVTDLSRVTGESKDLFASDGLHYSRQMHERWVARVLPQACSALAGENP